MEQAKISLDSINLEIVKQRDLDLFCELKKILVEQHRVQAKGLGLYDVECEEFTDEECKKRFGKRNCELYFILSNGNKIGILETEILISKIDNESCCFVHNIYIEEKEQRSGIGTKVFDALFQRYSHVELDCYYSMADDFYQSIGFSSYSVKYFRRKDLNVIDLNEQKYKGLKCENCGNKQHSKMFQKAATNIMVNIVTEEVVEVVPNTVHDILENIYCSNCGFEVKKILQD